MRIRKFRPEDLPDLVRCATECWNASYPAPRGHHARDAREYFGRFVRPSAEMRWLDCRCDVLVEDGRIVGFATYSCSKIDNWVYDLEEFGIRPDRQGRGFGKKFLRGTLASIGRIRQRHKNAEGRMEAANIRHIALVTTNPIAEKLYASCGARVVERAEVAGKERVIMLFVLPEGRGGGADPE